MNLINQGTPSGLIDPSLNGCLTNEGNNLKKEVLVLLAENLEMLSIGKGIKLMENTLKVFEKLLIEDLKNDVFLIDDFLYSMKIVLREKLYNRIDYGDIYKIAKEKHSQRKSDKWNAEKDAERLALIHDSQKYVKKQMEQRNKGAISLNEMIRRYPNDPELKALRAVIERAEKANENSRKPVR